MAPYDTSGLTQQLNSGSLGKQPKQYKKTPNAKGAGIMGGTGAAIGAGVGFPLGGPVGSAVGAGVGGLLGAGVGAISGKGGGSGKSFPKYSFDPSVKPEDILSGRVDISNVTIPTEEGQDKDWDNLSKSNPMLAKAIQARQEHDWNKMLASMDEEDAGPELSPLAVQLLYQQNINPFLQSVVGGLKGSANQYESLMGQLTSTLPEPYRKVMAANAPVQANLMRQIADANAIGLVKGPETAQLMDLIGKDYAARQAQIINQRINQQLGSSGGGDLASSLQAFLGQ